jgi:catechol 2,3-dioxygenase-like lactoylglutathione lyase family enzyme
VAKVVGLSHIGIFVKDLEKSQKFYKDILGFRTIWECEFSDADNTYTIAFIQNNTIVIELVKRKIQTSLGDGVTDHVAMAVDNLEEIIKDLSAKGIKFESREPIFCADMFEKGTKWIFFRGPDNEHIELAQSL